MDYTTAEQIIEKEKAGHVIHIMPRKLLVRIDGHKMFKISPATVNIYNYYKKYNWICK